MPFDPSDLAPILGTLFGGASALLFTAALGWRIAMKPTMRALMEYRASRPAQDPLLLRRISELEDEVRVLKAQFAVLPETSPARALLDAPWRVRDRA